MNASSLARRVPKPSKPNPAKEKPQSEVYSIGDLAREFGVTLRTLRFYEHRGLISPRREGLTRYYDARDKARLGVILKGKQLGFTLTEIRALLAKTDRSQSEPELPLSDDQVRAQIAHLEEQRRSADLAIAELRTKYPHIVIS